MDQANDSPLLEAAWLLIERMSEKDKEKLRNRLIVKRFRDSHTSYKDPFERAYKMGLELAQKGFVFDVEEWIREDREVR